MFETQIGSLVDNLMDRYIHVTGRFDFNADTFLPEYLLMEAGLLSETLTVAILVPVLCLGFEADRVQIDDGIDVIRLGDRIHIARAPSLRNASGFDPGIQMAATHSLVLADYSFANNGQFDLWRALGSRDSYPLPLIDTFFASVRLVVNGPTGYAQVLALPAGWASSFKADLLPLHTVQVRHYPPSLEERYWNGHLPKVTAKELETTISLFKRIRNLENEKFSKRLSIALRRLNSSSLRTNEDDGLLDSMIGMEALLSPESTSEMTHKIAFRMAGLYKILNPPMAGMAFGEIKKIYGVRSKIVHGNHYDMSSTIQRGSDKIRLHSRICG